MKALVFAGFPTTYEIKNYEFKNYKIGKGSDMYTLEDS